MTNEPAKRDGSLRPLFTSLTWTRVQQIGFSVADQGFSVGGMFLLNIALARTQPKEEYGVFALAYSIFAFLSGLHNAAILEAYTIHGSGRYHQHFDEYSRFIQRSNAWLCAGIAGTLLTVWLILHWAAPHLASRTVLGMALTCGVFLAASFRRATFYIRRRPDLAARFSAIFFVVCAVTLWIFMEANKLNGLSAFLIAASAWLIAFLFVGRAPSAGASGRRFEDIEPELWAEHWKYSRWVLVTAFIFQFTGQAYYWLAAALLSVKETGDLRALYNLVTPVDQFFAAVMMLILPMMSFRYASRRMSGLLPFWKAYSCVVLLVTAGFALTVNIFGRSLMHLLYSGNFDDVSPLLGTLVLLPVIMGIGNSINAALKASEKPQAVFAAYVASGAGTFIFGLPLIRKFGLRGVVYGMLASGALYTITLCTGFFSLLQAERRLSPALSAAKESVQL